TPSDLRLEAARHSAPTTTPCATCWRPRSPATRIPAPGRSIDGVLDRLAAVPRPAEMTLPNRSLPLASAVEASRDRRRQGGATTKIRRGSTVSGRVDRPGSGLKLQLHAERQPVHRAG